MAEILAQQQKLDNWRENGRKWGSYGLLLGMLVVSGALGGYVYCGGEHGGMPAAMATGATSRYQRVDLSEDRGGGASYELAQVASAVEEEDENDFAVNSPSYL